MTQVGVDIELFNKLKWLREPLELVDGRGRILARVQPMWDPEQSGVWEPVFDEADLRRQEQANEKRYTTAEVLEHLNKLGKKG